MLVVDLDKTKDMESDKDIFLILESYTTLSIYTDMDMILCADRQN